jgi:hypothetical protein
MKLTKGAVAVQLGNSEYDEMQKWVAKQLAKPNCSGRLDLLTYIFLHLESVANLETRWIIDKKKLTPANVVEVLVCEDHVISLDENHKYKKTNASSRRRKDKNGKLMPRAPVRFVSYRCKVKDTCNASIKTVVSAEVGERVLAIRVNGVHKNHRVVSLYNF